MDFSKLSFVEWVEDIHDAAVLVGAGSELIRSIFQATKGVLVESALQTQEAQVSPQVQPCDCTRCQMA